jgi:RNA polymerase sigma factor (sigma-70 family)
MGKIYDLVRIGIFKQLEKPEKLDFNEEQILILQAKNNNSAAIKKLIEANFGFIVKSANKIFCKYTYLPHTFSDLVGFGVEGFILAILGYKNGKKTRLLTYAKKAIKGKILENLNDEISLVKIPSCERKRRKKNNEEIFPVVLFRNFGNSRARDREKIFSQTIEIISQVIFPWEKIVKLAKLTDKEKAVFLNYYLLEKELRQIGKELEPSICARTLRQIKKSAVEKLKPVVFSIFWEEYYEEKLSIDKAQEFIKIAKLFKLNSLELHLKVKEKLNYWLEENKILFSENELKIIKDYFSLTNSYSMPISMISERLRVSIEEIYSVRDKLFTNLNRE